LYYGQSKRRSTVVFDQALRACGHCSGARGPGYAGHQPNPSTSLCATLRELFVSGDVPTQSGYP
jgi:hypothetical protein